MDEKDASIAESGTKTTESDGEPMTPSDHSDAEPYETSDSDIDDSDYQSENGLDNSNDDEDRPNIKWTGYSKKVPVLIFHPEAVLQNKCKYKKVGERFHMAFKFGSTESRIIRTVLLAHGFHEVTANHSDYNMLWIGGHLKPLTLRNMADFQKINHFPRSYELTRKDKLYKNVQRMQQIKGSRNFNFVPMSFVIPTEYQEFCSSFCKDRGPWIIKPVASSRGRGVHLVNHPDQIPLDENLIISKYIQNPLLIDGFKFDVRLYVAVTSYDPLVIYLYEEGLTRFATVRYDKSNRNLRNQCMHLTNYSVNKRSNGYVKNDDPDIEDYGNKWSLGALLRYLKDQGTDTAAMMMKIEDVVVKTILSAELHIAAASKMFVNNKWNCFELYGFDVLIDETLKPWILEVNLSPSLVCDSPLDLKIKTNLICDLFSAIGIVCHDPMVKNYQQIRKNMELAAQMNSGRNKRRPASAGASTSTGGQSNRSGYMRKGMSGLNSEEIKIVRRVKEEDMRKGGWIRLFPSPDSWDLYSPFLQYSTTHNLMLHQRLFPHRHKAMLYKCLSPVTSLGSRAKWYQILGVHKHKGSHSTPTHHQSSHHSRSVYSNLASSVSNLSKFENENCESFALAQHRAQQYERKLDDRRKRSRKSRRGRRRKKAESPHQTVPVKSHSKSCIEPTLLSEKITASSSQTKPYYYSSLEGLQKLGSVHRSNRSCPSSVTGIPPMGASITSKKLNGRSLTDQREEPVQKINLIEILENGGSLSQLQARTAFAVYLTKVQQRLVMEASSKEETNVESLNDQMDLVLRFLKRAAVNLQRNFHVVVPSKKLSVKDRSRILAKELGEFVQHYKKETQQLKRALQREPDDSLPAIGDDDFNHFLRYSSEGELELVLTTYAKLKKSASIFLGSCNNLTAIDSTDELSDSEAKNARVVSFLSSGKEYMSRPKNIQHLSTSPPKNPSHVDSDDCTVSKPGMSHTHHLSTGSIPSSCLPFLQSNPYAAQQAVITVYSQKLTRTRPSSTISFKPAAQISTQKPLPAPSNGCLPVASQDVAVDTYNEKAIQDALQSLVEKQQRRQYSAQRGTGILSQIGDQQPSALSMKVRSKSLERKHNKPPILLSASSCKNLQQDGQYSGSLKGPDGSQLLTSPDAFVHSHKACCEHDKCRECALGSSTPSLPHKCATGCPEAVCPDVLANIYSQVTGSLPQHYHTPPSVGSHQYQLAYQQQESPSDNSGRNSSMLPPPRHGNSHKLPQATTAPSAVSTTSTTLRITSTTASQHGNKGRITSSQHKLQKQLSDELHISKESSRHHAQPQTTFKVFQKPQQQQQKKKTKQTESTLRKLTRADSPNVASKKQTLFTPRPPLHRPWRPGGLYKANSCLIPQTNPKGHDQKFEKLSRTATSPYQTL